MPSPKFHGAAKLASLIVGCKQNYGKADVAICLDFFNDCTAFIGLLMKDDRLEPDLFKVASQAFASALIVAMNNEYSTRFHSFNGVDFWSDGNAFGLGKFNFFLKRIYCLL